MAALPENLLIKIVAEIHDPVTTTDELIPSGETSSYRSNPIKLASFALSRKDPAYVGRASEVQKGVVAREALLSGGQDGCGDGQEVFAALPELEAVFAAARGACDAAELSNTGIGSAIFGRRQY